MMKQALISVSEKDHIVEFARELSCKGIKLLSTGGTAKLLRKKKIPVTDVVKYTGFPEIMDGRVKTLHPKIHGGILVRRDHKKDLSDAKKNHISPLDLIVVNLYPFEFMEENGEVSEEDLIEFIDIGGVALLRAAAKNYRFVTVVTDPHDYETVGKEIEQFGDTTIQTRERLAWKAFERTYHYDEAIAHYFRRKLGMPELLDLHYEKVASLRYGENPHQKAAFFRNPLNTDPNVTNAKVLQGKQLSFNNIVDTDSALELVKEFERPTVVFVKHNNPCGVASANTIEGAFALSHRVDDTSAFGGVVAMNRPCPKAVVDYMNEHKLFLEIIVCPKFETEALDGLRVKKNLRLLETGPLHLDRERRDIKKVAGGILIQTANTYTVTEKDFKIVTKKKPTSLQIRAMLFANKVVKHVLSNAIIFAKSSNGGDFVIGVGAGQMSRVDAVFIAAHKSGKRSKGSVMASDAFFPFPDAVEEAHKAGIAAIIQPGGSIRDAEVIKRADDLGMSMVFTGIRMFRH